MRRQFIFAAIVACMLTAGAGLGFAKSLAVALSMSSVTARVGDKGNYYVVNLDVPEELLGKRLDSVFLEFVVDAAPTETMVGSQTPVVTVLPLTEEFRGANLAFRRDVATMQPVTIGETRGVRSDITEIIKGWIAQPSSNHGFVIGTLAGPAVGTVELRESGLGAGATLRLTYFYQNRFGERISSREE